MKQITPIHLMRAFEAAARHASFTKAASELHITQAAISKQIRALEKELNSSLFNRNAHGVSLTQAGERYWHDTRGFISNLDSITTQLFTERRSDIIRIRANISYSVELISKKIKWFNSQFPSVTIELTHNVWSKENQPGNADIEIDYRAIEPANPDYKLLHQDQIFPVMSANTTRNQLTNLATISILGYYNEWNWWLNKASELPGDRLSKRLLEVISVKRKELEQQSNMIRVDNSLSAYQLAVEGIGIALGRSSLVQSYIEKGLLKRIDTHTQFPALEGFHVHLTESGRSKQACVAFINHLFDKSDH